MLGGPLLGPVASEALLVAAWSCLPVEGAGRAGV